MLYLIFFILLILIFGTMLWAGFSAAPWLPSWKRDIKQILALAQVQPGQIVYDLGSGDGRWLFAFAKNSPAKKVIGLEISLLFYFWSRIKLLFSNYPQIEIHYQNFFKADLAQADVVLCFLTPRAMRKLKPKLEKELKPGGKLISYAFSLPGRTPKKVAKISKKSVSIYLYQF